MHKYSIVGKYNFARESCLTNQICLKELVDTWIRVI